MGKHIPVLLKETIENFIINEVIKKEDASNLFRVIE